MYLTDEDLPPRMAEISRGLGLDIVSVHELGRQGIPDDAQLRFAAEQGRTFVTRNRDDFRELTVEFFRAGEPHAGVLVIGAKLPNNHPERIARALKGWTDSRPEPAADAMAYIVDFL